MIRYEDYISPEEYLELRKLVGWRLFPLEEAKNCVENAYMVPTYINMSKGTGTAAVKLITLLGADFKRQFNLDSYKKFFEEKGYTGVRYHVVDGRMPCAIAVITKAI